MDKQAAGPKKESVSDRTLVRDVRAGDPAAAGQLHERYAERLQTLASRQLARETAGRLDFEDVTQSVFRTLFRRLQDGQYDVPAGESLWRLLTTIALNKIRSLGTHHRAAKRDIRRTSNAENQFLEATATSNDEVALNELRLTIATLVERLGESEQRMIQLRIEGHDIQSIAKLTARSKRSVERVLQGFRSQLNQTLNEET